MVNRPGRLVVAIGVVKLLKAAALGTVGVAALASSPAHVARTAGDAVAWTSVFPGRGVVEGAVHKLWVALPSSPRHMAALVLIYAAVFAVEGVGLLGRKRWAEWLTVIVTASFMPLEGYELARHFGAGKVVMLVANAAIVAYLAWRRLAERRGAGARGHIARPIWTPRNP